MTNISRRKEHDYARWYRGFGPGGSIATCQFLVDFWLERPVALRAQLNLRDLRAIIYTLHVNMIVIALQLNEQDENCS